MKEMTPTQKRKAALLTGSFAWILCLQYFMAQIVVANAWTVPFSLRNNYISDLGSTACAVTSQGYVCSPLHGLMNASFVLQGLLMLAGALAFAFAYRANKLAVVGFAGLALAGLGTILVGLVPENYMSPLHGAGAILAFVIGNLGVLFVGLARATRSRVFDVYTVAMGAIALVAFILFASKIFLGLGVGGMERVTSYAQVTWMISFGVYTYKTIAQVPVSKLILLK